MSEVKVGDRVKVIDYINTTPIGQTGKIVNFIPEHGFYEVALDDWEFQKNFSGGRTALFMKEEIEHVQI